jgi:hypothetical protein
MIKEKTLLITTTLETGDLPVKKGKNNVEEEEENNVDEESE